MPKKIFTEDEDEVLVELVSQNEILYNHEHQDYRHTEKKNGLWKTFGERLEKNGKLS